MNMGPNNYPYFNYPNELNERPPSYHYYPYPARQYRNPVFPQHPSANYGQDSRYNMNYGNYNYPASYGGPQRMYGGYYENSMYGQYQSYSPYEGLLNYSPLNK